MKTMYTCSLDTDTLAQVNAWLSPDGKFYQAQTRLHSEIADCCDATVHGLEMAGWVHISGYEIVNYPGTLRLTQTQRDILFDLIMLDPHTGYAHRINRYIQESEDY